MKINTLKVLDETIERGITYGWRRAHKHTEDPTEESLKHEIHNWIMIEISEYFHFDEVTETR